MSYHMRAKTLEKDDYHKRRTSVIPERISDWASPIISRVRGYHQIGRYEARQRSASLPSGDDIGRYAIKLESERGANERPQAPIIMRPNPMEA